jgi:hypothetical protein
MGVLRPCPHQVYSDCPTEFVGYFSDNSDLCLSFATAPTEGNAVTSKSLMRFTALSILSRRLKPRTRLKATEVANRLIPMSKAQGLAPRFSVSEDC